MVPKSPCIFPAPLCLILTGLSSNVVSIYKIGRFHENEFSIIVKIYFFGGKFGYRTSTCQPSRHRRLSLQKLGS
ncbi:hypothetical protein HOY82DRAFT_556067 [Tuber indicum]|nr:hypothetical protein HOY82DRAFT_556067 [Tuber indicum]